MNTLRAAGLAWTLSFGALDPAVAQRVLLEVRPHPGDTLRVTLEHAFTVSGGPRNFPDSVTTNDWTYHIETRDIVERSDTRGAFVLAIIDSVRMRTTGSLGASPFPGVDRGMEGLRVRLQVMPDGSAVVIDGLKQLDPDLRALFGSMPAVLPATAVAIGESWTRDLPLPVDGSPASGNLPGKLTATFRLDSLTGNGDRAWISLRGRVESTPPKVTEPGAPVFHMSGTLTGLLLLDRRRGWLSESRATVVMESVVNLASGGGPLIVRVKVNQVMRTTPVSVRR